MIAEDHYKFMTSEDGMMCIKNYGVGYVYEHLKERGRKWFIANDL